MDITQWGIKKNTMCGAKWTIWLSPWGGPCSSGNQFYWGCTIWYKTPCAKSCLTWNSKWIHFLGCREVEDGVTQKSGKMLEGGIAHVYHSILHRQTFWLSVLLLEYLRTIREQTTDIWFARAWILGVCFLLDEDTSCTKKNTFLVFISSKHENKQPKIK